MTSPLTAPLRRVRARWRRQRCATRALQSLLLLCGWVLLLHAADLLVPLDIATRTVLLPVNSALILAAAFYPLLPLLRPFPLTRAAALIEARCPELRQEITTAWQWTAGRSPCGREQYSPEIVAALQESAVRRMQALPLSGEFPVAVLLARGAAVMLLMLLAGIVAAPSQFSLTLRRYARPSAACGDWRGARIGPGSVRIASGQGIAVTAVLGEFRVRWRKADGAVGSAVSRDGQVELAGITQRIEYQVSSRRMQSPSYVVSVYRPLALSDITVRIVPPAYSRLPQSVSENQGDISGLKGSQVLISAAATQRLSQARMALDGAETKPGSITADRLISIAFVLRRSGGYRLWARSLSGDTLLNGTRFTVTAVPDEPPTVELLAPQDGAVPDNDMAVTVRSHAADDFGLSVLNLVCEDRGGRQVTPIAQLKGSIADTTLDYHWNLGNLGLLPGDSLVYWLEAADNDAVSGHKTARSRKQVLRLASIDDVFRQQQLADSASLQSLRQEEPQNSALRQELERLSQAVKESRQLEWQQQAAIEQAVQQEQRLLQDLQRSVEQSLEEMRADPARFSFDSETMAKLSELRQLFDQTATDEMRRAMEQMRQAIEQANRAAVEQALDQLKLSQNEFKQRLDAAITSLKQLQQEQQLGLLQRKAEELLQEQQDVKQRTAAAASDQQRQQLARRQEQLAKDTEFLGKQLQEQAAGLERVEAETARSLQNAAQQLQRDQTAETMRRAGQQIRSQQDGPAQTSQQQAINDLAQLSSGIKRAASGMRSQRSQAAARAMRQKANAIVGLSQQQEDLNQRLAQSGGNRNDLADQQQALERAAARLQQEVEQLQQQPMPMSPQAGKAMAQATAQMRMAAQSAADGRGQQAGDQGRGAQAALNQAAMALMQSAAQRSGSSGSGDMMEDLDGLASRQQTLNQQSGQLADHQLEMQLQAMQSQIPRLAAEQAAIRQGMQQYNQRYADRADRTGRLDDLAQEMQKVIDDMTHGTISRETQQRQEKILTRMLDAQHSLQERDFSRQRQAQPGTIDDATRGPRTATPASPSWKSHQRWQNWRNEHFPLEYQQMLENYFKSLGQ